MEEENIKKKSLKPMITLVVVMSVLLVVGFGFVVYGMVSQYNSLVSK